MYWHQLASSLMCLAASVLLVLLMVFLFCRLTKYNDWEEIQRGNVAAALALGGKVLGLANVMRSAIMSNMGAVEIVAWGMVGMVLLLLVYLAFEWLTPRLKVNEEIAGGNVAVGALSMVFSLAASLIIGASIS